MYWNKYSTWLRSNYLIIIIFIISTSFFLLQHASILSWDFSSYVLNAQYLFYNGDYFELYRSPLVPLLLGLFMLIGIFGEYLFIIFVSLLFLYSNITLSDTFFSKKGFISKEETRFIFYLFSLSEFVLIFATKVGTEMLALSLLSLLIAFVIKGKISGQFIALSFLSRYNGLYYFPFLFLYKNYKKILLNLVIAFVLIFPWLLFNFLTYGNWFASIIDSYALNIYFRLDRAEPFNVYSIFQLINWFAPFLLIGIGFAFYRLYKTKFNYDKNKILYLVLLFALLVFVDVISSPFKIDRYLFNLSCLFFNCWSYFIN